MNKMLALLQKDLEQLKNTLGPALLFCLPILLLLSMGSEFYDRPQEFALLSFWVSFFLGISSLYYRSFYLEHRFSCFSIYTTLRVPKWMIFCSQSFVNFLGSVLIGFTYSAFVQIFWNIPDFNWAQCLALVAMISLSLACLGTLLSLLLQVEREFLFALFFLPVATPLFLSALSVSLEGQETWIWIMAVFLCLSVFLSAMLFEFFFDELTQSH
jgi:ABC-type transport system involved in cytochrome c biogenesis permease component